CCWRWCWCWPRRAAACARRALGGAAAKMPALHPAPRTAMAMAAMEAAMPEAWDGVLVGANLATLDGDAGYAAIEDGALGWREGRIVFAGRRDELPAAPERLADCVVEADGGWVTPGLVDCHTHLVFAGDRATEFVQRLQGADYEQIARGGGGVTPLEIKCGDGRDFDGERRTLRVARRIGQSLGVDVRTTFLGAHALPPEYAGRGDDYIEAVCDWLPRLHDEALVDAVDAFA